MPVGKECSPDLQDFWFVLGESGPDESCTQALNVLLRSCR